MNLIEIKDDSAIKSALGLSDVSIERKDGKISRLILGPLAAPTAVIEKGGTYSDHLSITMAQRKTKFASSADFLGAILSNEFDTEEAREKWEIEVQQQHPSMSFDFAHSTKIVVI